MHIGKEPQYSITWKAIRKTLLVDPPPLKFLSLIFINHILGGSASDILWQLSDEVADGCVIANEWKNPVGFYGSLCRPQPSNGHRAHHSRIFEGRSCVDKIHIEPQYRWRHFLSAQETSSCRPSKSQASFAGSVNYRTTSAYNWYLGINLPVETQKWSDNYQNMRIILADQILTSWFFCVSHRILWKNENAVYLH